MLAPSAETIARTPLSPLAAPSLEISLSGSRLRHNREISISSIASGSTVTSVSTVSTTQSERRYDTTFIVDLDDGQDDERPLLLSDDARRRPILSTARSFRSIAKSLLHLPSSQGGPESRHILWTKPGPLDLSKVERLVKKHQGTVDSFTMTPGTFAPYNGLSETVKKLGVLVSDVQEIVLLSQFYTLEEVQCLTPYLARFSRLRSLSILDTSNNPPEGLAAINAIVFQWGTQCPSLREVRFNQSAAWRREGTLDGRSRSGGSWALHDDEYE